MTTDELRTWMNALEERDMRIAKLEKLVAEHAAQIVALMTMISGPLPIPVPSPFKEQVRLDQTSGPCAPPNPDNECRCACGKFMVSNRGLFTAWGSHKHGKCGPSL